MLVNKRETEISMKFNINSYANYICMYLSTQGGEKTTTHQIKITVQFDFYVYNS